MELLLVSHKGVASGIKSASRMIIGDLSESIGILELTEEQGIEVFSDELDKYIENWLSDGKTAVIFADLKGGTPYNRAEMILAQKGLKNQAKVISGMNLPMVIDTVLKEVDNWDKESLSEIVELGKDSIASMDLAVNDCEFEDE